jgi:hypothetical protein
MQKDSLLFRFAQFCGALLAAVPCFYLSWALFNVWRDPMSWEGGSWVRFGVGLLLLEFVLIHSGAFMAASISGSLNLKKKLIALAGLALFYGLMVWGFTISLESPELLWIYGSVILGRSATAFTNGESGSGIMVARSGVGLVIYLVVVMATVFIPIPEWGVTSSVLAEVFPDRGSGVWAEEPHRAVAGAAIYFGAMALVELFLIGPNWMNIGEVDKNTVLQSD